jgi:hypothetical protein
MIIKNRRQRPIVFDFDLDFTVKEGEEIVERGD